MKVAALVAMLVVAAGSAGGAGSSGSADEPVVSAAGTAVVDGTIGEAEWHGAARVEFTVKPNGASGVLLVMNDDANLYLAYRVATVPSGWNDVGANFDNDGDGVFYEGDQALVVSTWNGQVRDFYDEYYTYRAPCAFAACMGIEDSRTGGTTDGAAAGSSAGGYWSIEIALPLDDADDAHDFSLARGDLLSLASADVNLCDSTTCTRTVVSGLPLRIVVAPYVSPAIASAKPARGAAGTDVVIAGAHFGGATSVTFGGRPATFDVVTGSEIWTTVPVGATSGRIGVTTPGGTALSQQEFVVPVARPLIGPPTIAPATPAAGRPASVTFRVRRSDTGAALVGGTLAATPTVAGHVIPHREALKNGVGTLRFVLPKPARGHTLHVSIAVTYAGRKTTREASFPVR